MVIDWTRVPVVVGAGQVTNRETDPTVAPDPFTLMADAARLATGETTTGDGAAGARVGRRGGPRLAELSDCWMVHSMSLRHADPARALADHLDADDAETRCAGMGGSIPQWLVNRAAEEVVSGRRPRVLVVGAEALATRRRARQQGVHLQWPRTEGWPDTWPPLEGDLGLHPVERANLGGQATTMYALIETALIHAAGHDAATHRRAMGALMDPLNAVAAANPHAWFRTRRTAEELTTVTAENRMICFPYPKYLNAVMDVDMAAAVVVTDAATAREWGWASDEVAYVTGWADAKEVWHLCARPEVHRSPVLAKCAETAMAMAGIALGEVSAFDLYSCFPSALEVARRELGIADNDARALTLTGGLPYHGGPGSNYVTHAVANALQWLRDGPVGAHVLVHGNGYYLTKQAVAIYSLTPPTAIPEPAGDLQAQLDAEASTLPVDAAISGRGQVVAYSAPYDRSGVSGPAVAIVDVGGTRTAAVADDALSEQLLSGDGVGVKVTVATGDPTNSVHPG